MPLHEERGEGWGHLGAPETAWEHQEPPPLLEPLPPLTQPFLQAHPTGIDTRRWRTHIALPCTITMGAVPNCLRSKTLARRHNDPSEKWALIACTAGQACPMSTGSHATATPSLPQAGEAKFQAGSGAMVLVTARLLETSRSEDVSRKLLAILWTEAHSPHQELPATHARLTETHSQLEYTSVCEW